MEAVAWLIPLLIIILTIWTVSRERDRMRRRTAAEYERDVAQAHDSLLRAGMLELDRFVGSPSEKRAAVAYLKDEEEGMTPSGGKDDDADRTKAVCHGENQEA
jgi:hypothetical protein